MKKIVLAVMATSILLTNVAFASTKTHNTKTRNTSFVEQYNNIHVCSQDPN